MKFITLLFAILLSAQVQAKNCAELLPFGFPTIATQERVTQLCRKMYAVAHSPSRHTAYWSAEHLIGSQQNVDNPRINDFKADPNLPANEAAKPSDYKNTGYDQGHMAAVGNMHIDAAAMLESFYLSNMVPQVPANNRDGWNHLEYFVRGSAMRYQDVYVITGPVYQCNPCKTIGITKVAVPTHLYKIVYNPHTRIAISFLVPNIPFTEKEIPQYVSDIKTIQNLTGITFFPQLKAPITEVKQLWAIR